MSHTTILIVEDEPIIALDIEEQLNLLGYRVVAIADCAKTALEAVIQAQPNLILMDIHLIGEVNGIATAAQIREQFGLPVVFLTAHADAATLEQVKATQPFGYIVKPFETHDLSVTIETALSRHQAEIAIQTALKKEKELNQLKSRFVSIVSHEFRNPLSTILFSLDLLDQPESRLLPEKKLLYLDRARDAIEQMKQLLEDVLVIGELEANSLCCHPVPLHLLNFCQELVEQFQEDIGANSLITFTASGYETSDNQIYFLDEKLLRHILTNLLSNAVKYSPDGGRIQFDLIYEPTAFIFRIQDQGIGIPIEDQVNLFNFFYRGTNVNKIPGTGLGLSIVKQCVEAHGGQIAVESEVGAGTVFTITLHSHPIS